MSFEMQELVCWVFQQKWRSQCSCNSEYKSTASFRATVYISMFPLKETQLWVWENGHLRRKPGKSFALREMAAPQSFATIVLIPPYVSCIWYSMEASAVCWMEIFRASVHAWEPTESNSSPITILGKLFNFSELQFSYM